MLIKSVSPTRKYGTNIYGKDAKGNPWQRRVDVGYEPVEIRDDDAKVIMAKWPGMIVEVIQKAEGPKPEVDKKEAAPPSPATKPETVADGYYWCGKCFSLHKVDSKIGARHLKHKV